MSISGHMLIADISGYTEFVRLHNLKRNRSLVNLWLLTLSHMQPP